MATLQRNSPLVYITLTSYRSARPMGRHDKSIFARSVANHGLIKALPEPWDRSVQFQAVASLSRRGEGIWTEQTPPLSMEIL
jgi:hypothetical protein